MKFLAMLALLFISLTQWHAKNIDNEDYVFTFSNQLHPDGRIESAVFFKIKLKGPVNGEL